MKFVQASSQPCHLTYGINCIRYYLWSAKVKTCYSYAHIYNIQNEIYARHLKMTRIGTLKYLVPRGGPSLVAG